MHPGRPQPRAWHVRDSICVPVPRGREWIRRQVAAPANPAERHDIDSVFRREVRTESSVKSAHEFRVLGIILDNLKEDVATPGCRNFSRDSEVTQRYELLMEHVGAQPERVEGGIAIKKTVRQIRAAGPVRAGAD